jgi:hypothetical protein
VSALGRLAPPFLRRAVGRARGELVRAKVLGALQQIARSGRPVLAGPWVGEVGFEILYWIPFLRWMRDALGLSPDRVVAISRGGPESWYRDVAASYVDVFDLMGVEEYRAGNESRRRDIGEQKQLRQTGFDDTLLDAARARTGHPDAEVLHPAVLYRLLRPYWWHHASADWVEQHARYSRVVAPPLPDALGLMPRSYVAVKFYSNDCFSLTPATTDWVNRVTAAAAAQGPVVSLGTDIVVDEHRDTRATTLSGVSTVTGHLAARNNLDVQTAVVAHAKALIGTYGGFSYLGPLCGVATRAVFSDRHGFDRSHLDLARRIFHRLGDPPFDVVSLDETAVDAVIRVPGVSQ